MTDIDLDTFERAYIETMLFTETDDDDCPLDEAFDITDLPNETILALKSDCEDFRSPDNTHLLELAEEEYGYDDEKAGIDFWLTRNRHSAGYWDRGLSHYGDELTKAAHSMGERRAYIGDNGQVYIA
jgi:hypothetical protein